jgi:2-keto-3-deoxy-L-rhamnonate aldolase
LRWYPISIPPVKLTGANISYHYPLVSNNVAIAPQTFAQLSTHPNIVGCKLSHGNLSQHAQIASNPSIDHVAFATFTGLGQQLTSALTVGCAGAIDGLAGVFPKTMMHLFKLALSGENIKEVQRLQYVVSTANEMIVKHSAVGIKVAVRKVLGFGAIDGMRPPLASGLPGGDTEWDTWRRVVGDMWLEENKLP